MWGDLDFALYTPSICPRKREAQTNVPPNTPRVRKPNSDKGGVK